MAENTIFVQVPESIPQDLDSYEWSKTYYFCKHRNKHITSKT